MADVIKQMQETDMPARRDIVERFWEKVEKTDGCWNWVGYSHVPKKGYGRIRVNGKMRQTHRVSYEMHHGHIPDGMCVLHHCDNPRCVNPDHLFIGTNADNVADKVAKGRVAVGEQLRITTLTPNKVRAIRKLNGTVPRRVIGKIIGCAHGTVNAVLDGRTWGHVNG